MNLRTLARSAALVGALAIVPATTASLAQVDGRVIESLEHINVPTLVLVGENDAPFINASQYMAKKIPNASYVVVPDAGHAANLDQPVAFNAAVETFLAGLPG